MVHLHCHSWFSLPYGTMSPQTLPILAQTHGMTAVALTDRNSLAGAMMFYQSAVSLGIKPLIGVYLDERDGTEGVVLLAKTMRGYQSLCELVSARHLDPDFQLSTALLMSGPDLILLSQSKTLCLLGRERGFSTYFELVLDSPAHLEPVSYWKQYLQPVGIPCIASNAIWFEKMDGYVLVQLQHAIAHKTSRHAQQAKGTNIGISALRYFRSQEEMRLLFESIPQALIETQHLSDQIELSFQFGCWLFPSVKPHTKDSVREQLVQACEQKIGALFGRSQSVYQERLAQEFEVITTMGFLDYIWVVWDIVRYANQHQLPTIGRGSAANSLVLFLLGITHVDPVAHSLYFERFLNPERTSPPDIDLDFCWRKRGKILDYVMTTYGVAHTAMIGTTVTFGCRAAFREVARVYGLSESEISSLTRFFPYHMPDTVEALHDCVPALKETPLKNAPYRHILSYAMALTGCPRHLSVHPGGVVISPKPLSCYSPCQRSANQRVITQIDMHGIEALGLIKIDILGNRGLSVYQDTLRQLNENGVGMTVPQEVSSLEKDSKTVYALKTGQTIGCFYIESPGMRALLQKLKTSTYRHLVAASSVIRPGVAQSGMMAAYIDRARDPSQVSYVHPQLKTLLSETYGVMVYQEDVLKVAHHVAGFTLAEADVLRRAMSGKGRSPQAIKVLQRRFFSQCLERHISQPITSELWRQMSSFAGYAFCKAHSASYSQLSFKLMYLKTHYPVAFMASVLSNQGGFYQTGVYIWEAKRLGIPVLLPCVNRSTYHYRPESVPGNPIPAVQRLRTGALRIGLLQVGRLNRAHVYTLLKSRLQDGPFRGLADLAARTDLGASELEGLILVGACDCFRLTRPELLFQLKALNLKSTQRQLAPFIMPVQKPALKRPYLTPYSLRERCRYEQDILGFMVSQHPLWFYQSYLVKERLPSTALAKHEGRFVQLLGWCIAKKQSRTRKGEPMTFMSMEDLVGTFEVTLFPKVYAKYARMTCSQGPYLIEGRVDLSHGIPSVVATQLTLLPSLAA